MAKQKPRERQIGKKDKVPGKKPLIDPRYKNVFWTTVTIVVLLIFFIVNNTRDVPESGPLPPAYNQQSIEQPSEKINEKVKMQHPANNNKE